MSQRSQASGSDGVQGIGPSILRGIVTTILRTETQMSDDVDELVQIVALKMLECDRAGKSAEIAARSSYVRTIAKNSAIDLFRARRRTLLVPEVGDDLFSLSDVEGGEPDAALASMRSYIGSLPPDLRAVFALRFEQGLPQSTVCSRLTISRQHLRTLEHRLKTGALHTARASNPRHTPPSAS